MDNLETVPTVLRQRRYALMIIKNKKQLACYVNNEWIVDKTCASINELLDIGIVSEDSVRGWISLNCQSYH